MTQPDPDQEARPPERPPPSEGEAAEAGGAARMPRWLPRAMLLVRADWLRTYVQKSAGGVFDFSASVLGGLFRLLTIFLFAFYFAVDGPRLRRGLCSLLPPAKQTEVLRAWEMAVDKTSGR